ncbi:MAG: hypothetical protein COV55_01930 [Candidatus Komeilibacteria bacterium CG11_big_fil_rev_8_21_14_0_20_36_20]|uniref:Phosphoribosyltransferase domain-containing protein n=1 Tax=Candidatus Komeilibacteria bacterium CG11_big_fil_rev_8_21_14_0_20_36_20 TaxID=1974477 RepID=A0A2H0ND62_9BACT|nr:MAG: hypothetical protein COV55_01930 [Candidatus Komeilibacteria bacterium CG11_big_fil_rev_8_21_14_0_20_36_20]PIR81556.1 MAG: hypothetical protein COU21_02740 [Candidatus Komeilibacteria bacterium CG10_big_fil_rev_8_21_14_0_10_36_65]PJC55394.1 MAG: hypothetical protein CO027_02040 [Candidatus Komeilibacteria bacterium CG_4_9_14_0_2_um_filter_36_13]
MIKKIFSNLLDYIWPQFCLGCHQEGSLCCDACAQNLKLLPLQPTPWTNPSYFYFQRCYVCLSYEDPLIEKLIKNFKYHYLENLSQVLITILQKQIQKIDLHPNTIIVNVPLHPRKKRQRGFDQTEILAKGLAKKLNLTYYPLLQRIKTTKTQAQLTKEQRQKNVAGVFKINKKIPQQLQHQQPEIILIDDVATTGATLNQAAKVLKKAGFEQITCAVLAKN